MNTTRIYNNEMVKFFIKSFKPNYVIHITKRNKIINFDERFIEDFSTDIRDSEDFIGHDIIALITKSSKYAYEFPSILNDIINSSGTGLCALNTSLKEVNCLTIPAIYIMLVIVELKVIGGNQVKEIKLYNYIEIAKFLSTMFNDNMYVPLVNLSKIFKNSVREKSLYFAFESLKPFATFLSNEFSTKTNQQQLANLVFPFHKSKSNEITQRFTQEFLRSSGYIEYDKNRKIKELSLDTLKRITSKNLIPFNSLDANFIIRLT